MPKGTPTNQQLAETQGEDPLVNESDAAAAEATPSPREETGAERQAKVIGLLRKEIENLKEKLKERKEDQIKMLFFRDMMQGFASRGKLDTDVLGKVQGGGQKEIERLIDHAMGLSEVMFSRTKGRLFL